MASSSCRQNTGDLWRRIAREWVRTVAAVRERTASRRQFWPQSVISGVRSFCPWRFRARPPPERAEWPRHPTVASAPGGASVSVWAEYVTGARGRHPWGARRRGANAAFALDNRLTNTLRVKVTSFGG